MSEISPPLQRALLSYEGLATGDAFGQCFFIPDEEAASAIAARQLPATPWLYTDDTLQAASIVAVLRTYGVIHQDALATSLAREYQIDRAYGPGMHSFLSRLRDGEDWRVLAPARNEGQGSFGNGAAMRVAPLGAYFADDLAEVARQAALSAVVTHTHEEAVHGAMAVAVAAALAWRGKESPFDFHSYFAALLEYMPAGVMRDQLRKAFTMHSVRSIDYPVAVLGNGTLLSALDTVPLAIWCAAQSLTTYQESLWTAVSALGDRDTLCAIVGGIVGLIDPPPDAWRHACEPIPDQERFVTEAG